MSSEHRGAAGSFGEGVGAVGLRLPALCSSRNSKQWSMFSAVLHVYSTFQCLSLSLLARQAPAAAPVFRGSVSLGQTLAGRSAPER